MRDDPIFTTILDSLIDCLAFFEHCDDEVLDDRIALKQLEWVAYKFDHLTYEQRLELAGHIRSRVGAYESPQMKTFVEEMPESFGLEDDDDE